MSRLSSMRLGNTIILVVANAMITIGLVHASTPPNLLENGSFEFGSDRPSFEQILYSPDNATKITGWYISSGSVDWARGRWQMASDCTPTCIDLSGAAPGIITSSFNISAGMTYTVLLDAAANPDAGTVVKGNFSVFVQQLDSNTETILNSSVVSVDSEAYNQQNIGWKTSWFIFSTSTDLAGRSYNLTLSSNIQGIYGPLVDNVRVYEGVLVPKKSLEEAAACKTGGTSKTLLAVVIVVPTISIVALTMYVYFWWRKKKHGTISLGEILHVEGKAQIFAYNVLKNATENFNQDHKLGEGAFGEVFKGILRDGTEVAVKRLSSTSRQGQQEFLNEVTVISRVQHRNLVTLKGCCMEGGERLLVYEFLENGSLSQALLDSKDAVHLHWPTRFKIAVGTARGLAYLHQGSQPRILHRDIKASNILLDKNFDAKIADFGLAKLFPDGETHVSTRVAGTVGYLAPEYAWRGLLTDKADIFSFGIVALELVSGRRNMDNKLPQEQLFLLDWARLLYTEDQILKLIDPKLEEDGYNEEEVLRVIKVALLCTQQGPENRPAMVQVVTLLTGEVEGGGGVLGLASTESKHVPLLMNSYILRDSYSTSVPSTSFSVESM